jgi:hypothetical protein
MAIILSLYTSILVLAVWQENQNRKDLGHSDTER